MRIYRNYSKNSSKEILLPHEASTLSRIEEEKVVLILQDTTDINYSNRKPIKEMGYLKRELRIREFVYYLPKMPIFKHKIT